MNYIPAHIVDRPSLTLVKRDEMAAVVAAVDAVIDSAEFIPTRDQPCAVMRPRGVYISDVTHNGVPVVYSVDSKHDVLQWAPWHEGHLLETIQRDLWGYLNAIDPIDER